MRSLKLFVILKCVVELYLLCLADFSDQHFFLGDKSGIFSEVVKIRAHMYEEQVAPTVKFMF